MSASLSNIIDKCEYLTGEEILPFDQREVIGQAKFAYSPFAKAFDQQAKTIEEQGGKKWSFRTFKTRKKQELETIERLFPNKDK